MAWFCDCVAATKKLPIRPRPGNQSYIYAADGTKISFTPLNGINKSYIATVEYNTGGGVLRIGTEEGHVMLRPLWNENSKDSKYVYYYTIKDHLGNVRMVLDDDANANVWQKTDYNAFGLDAKNDFPQGISAGKERNNHLYNDKESDPETTRLDYGARQYDNVLGRWFVVDPLAEKYYSQSSYNYVINNPLLYIDPNGMEVDVSKLEVYAQVQLILGLSRITGNNIGIKDGKLVDNGPSNSKEKSSKSAASYVNGLITSNQLLKVETKNSEGSYNLKGKVYLNTFILEETQNSFGDSNGWGTTFLHESLHTGWAANIIDKSNYDGFVDIPIDPNDPNYNPNGLGPTEVVVNSFRKEMGLVERTKYMMHETYDSNGKLISTTWNMGGKDVIQKPINPLLTLDKILKAELHKKIKK